MVVARVCQIHLITKKVNTRVDNVETIEQEQDLNEDKCGGISTENDSVSIEEQTPDSENQCQLQSVQRIGH